jgi:F-box and leucine-rich repeat protein 1 (S-phase kinase-associated protein 2)
LSSYKLDDLPDEVILNILGFLNIKELILSGQVSKQLQAIANDESLWLKLYLYGRKVPYDFIEKAAGNGCQYLRLAHCDIIGLTGKSESSFKFKYLNMYQGRPGVQKLVQNCSALQKLSVAGLTLDSDDIQYICQNSQTLQVLDLGDCKFDLHKLQDLLTNCAHLTELNIYTDCGRLLDPHIQALVDNLTPTILKLALGGQVNLQDEHVKNWQEVATKLLTWIVILCTASLNN